MWEVKCLSNNTRSNVIKCEMNNTDASCYCSLAHFLCITQQCTPGNNKLDLPSSCHLEGWFVLCVTLLTWSVGRILCHWIVVIYNREKKAWVGQRGISAKYLFMNTVAIIMVKFDIIPTGIFLNWKNSKQKLFFCCVLV